MAKVRILLEGCLEMSWHCEDHKIEHHGDNSVILIKKTATDKWEYILTYNKIKLIYIIHDDSNLIKG